MCLVPTRTSDLMKTSPEKRHSSFWDLPATVASAHRRPREEKSAKRFRAPLHCPAAARVDGLGPQDKPGPPRGSLAVWRGPPTPRAQGEAPTGAPLPATGSRDEGAEVPGGGLHPQGLLFPRKSECLLSAAVIKVGGWWRTARVCKPIQGWMGTEAPGGGRRRASDDRLPLPPNPDQPSRSGFNLPEDKAALEAAPGQCEAPSTLREGVCV